LKLSQLGGAKMSFSNDFLKPTLPVLLVAAILAPGTMPAIAQEKAEGEAKSAASPTPANNLATRPVNEKILPLIKEGYAFLGKGSYDKAIKVLKKAIAIDKDSISARRYLAYAEVQSGHAKDALGDMQVVAKLVQPNAFDFYLFAAAYYAAGGVKEAKDCYIEALRQNPAYDAARAGLVKTLAHEHNFEEALNIVQQGLMLTQDQKVKRYYTSLTKAVLDAQKQVAQSGVGIVNTAPVAPQAGDDSVRAKAVMIK